MLRTSPNLSRTRAALLIASALTLVLGVVASWVRADAVGAQRTTTRPSTSTPTTRDQGPVTTADPPVTRTRPRQTTEPEPPPTTRATRPSTSAARATSTTRRAAAPSSAPAVTAPNTTTMPTLPGSTVTPALLVPGPNNTMTGPPQPIESEGVSATAALRWVIIGLVLVGLAIAGLTVAFWRHTRPRRPEPWDETADPPAGPPGTPGTPAPGFTPVARGGADPFAPREPQAWDPAPNVTRPWDPPSSVTVRPRDGDDSGWGSY